MKSLISKKRLTEEERKKERRTKQSLDSPQTIEANKNPTDYNNNIIMLIFISTRYVSLLDIINAIQTKYSLFCSIHS